MYTKPLTKEQEHLLNQERFKKTPEEKLELKKAKAEWKKNYAK